jgi:hypothetical protein
MEYLMTYGWAILIIAVVLGALFQLGVFNANNFAPKAPPGTCQVFRPNGPGTTSFINLEGVCSGELPQYVAQFNGSYSSYVSLTSVSRMLANSITIAAWIDPIYGPWWYRNIVATNCFRFEANNNGYPPNYGLDFDISSICGTGGVSLGSVSTVNIYSFVAVTFNGVAAQLYVNGAAVAASSASRNSNTITAMHIGMDGLSGIGGIDYMFGQISNVQIYNTSLSANEIQALYLEGIGGAPIDLQNLVGWWPLNGDANDYSGNGNNGQATNVIYTGSWTSGYTTP